LTWVDRGAVGEKIRHPSARKVVGPIWPRALIGRFESVRKF
jgi:hypothetical protein